MKSLVSALGLVMMLTLGVQAFAQSQVTGAATESGPDGPSWPRWRGPQGDGISMEVNWDPQALAAGPKILWTADVGTSYSNVAIQDNRLFTMGHAERKVWVYCFEADSGKSIWRYSFPKEERLDPQSTPTLDRGRVYALGRDGTLVCLSMDSGELQWKKSLVSELGAVAPYYGFSGSPVIDGELLIIEANTSGLALNRNTGEVVWMSDQPPKGDYGGTSTGAGYATPVLYELNGKHYATVGSYKGLSAVDAETGRPLWIYDWQKNFTKAGDHITDPIIFGDKLFFVQYYPSFPGCALLDIGGEVPRVLWANGEMSSETSSPVLLNGYFYLCKGGINSRVGSLCCLDAETGRLVWEEKLNGKPITITAADRKLIVLDEKGTVFIGEGTPSGFTVISSSSISAEGYWRVAPVLCGGRIYCRDYLGGLVCLDVRKR